MKTTIYTRKKVLSRILVLSLGLLLFMTGCEIQENFEYVYSNAGGQVDMTAWEFIQAQDSLSLFEAAIIQAGMQSYYSGTTVRTFIVPRNSAWRTYLSSNGYSSFADVPAATLEDVLKYHIVNAKVLFSDPDLLESNNPIAYDTENGQIMYLSHNTNYQGLINQGTKKSWTIITSNIEPENGVIHITSAVVYLSI